MYNFVSFGSITLPDLDPESQQDPAAARLMYVDTMAGGYDALAGADADRGIPYTVNYRCNAANDNATTLRTLIESLRAAVGTRQLLKRQAQDDANEVHVCYARLAALPHNLTPENINHQGLTLPFSIESNWYGKAYTDWFTETGLSLDSGQAFGTTSLIAAFTSGDHEFTYINDGNLTISDAVLKVTVGGSDTAASLIFNRVDGFDTDFHLTVTESLVAGDVVVVDAGAQKATKNGTELIHSKITTNLSHKILSWFELIPVTSPGRTLALTSSLTADSTAELMYVEQWA